MKIVYVINTLGYTGGGERIVSEKMSYLADVMGYDITAVTCHQFPKSSPLTYPLSSKVKVVHLQIEDYKQYQYHYPKRLWIRWRYYNQLQIRLQETINMISPDILIGLGYSQADIVCKIKTKASIIIESHEARPFSCSWFIHDDASWLSKTYYKVYRKYYLHTIEKYADVVVSLTQADAKEWREAKRVEVIPNFSSMKVKIPSSCKEKRAIAVGRLVWQKGYDRLLNIWQLVNQRHPDWKLDIFGKGELENDIKQMILQKNIRNIEIHPFTNNISQEYSASSLYLLTSHYEGFSLTLVEAQCHGVPCISFDCPYGPSDIIDDGQCGLLAKNGDIDDFTEKVCYLIEHPEIRAKFSAAAIKKASTFNKESIMGKWVSLFMSLNKNNKN